MGEAGGDWTEKPIIFSDASVRAILEGRKTQTRRLVKPPRRKVAIWDDSNTWNMDPGGTQLFGPGPYIKMPFWHRDDPRGDDYRQMERVRCPYGYPEHGDRLWVRETWCLGTDCKSTMADEVVRFRADNAWYHEGQKQEAIAMPRILPPRWRPSIHMPRWACRLVLRITKVRVERLQDITYRDMLAEGLVPEHHGSPATTKQDFALLWDRLNGKRAPWASNPWVWVLDFEVER
jgi:hypothetical protein